MGLIPGLGRFPGGGNGNPLQFSCLEWTEEPGGLQPIEFAKSWTRLSTHVHVLPVCAVSAFIAPSQRETVYRTVPKVLVQLSYFELTFPYKNRFPPLLVWKI